MKILIVNGPNLNYLGKREPSVYGYRTYDDLVEYINNFAKANNVKVVFYQSNHEGEIIDKIYEVHKEYDALIINGGGYAHTSVAIMDCIKGLNLKTINVHLTDVSKREPFRQLDYLAMVSEKTFMGRGFDSYIDAIDYLIREEK